MKNQIEGSWIVEGFYRLMPRTSTWEYQFEFRTGHVVWEFGAHTLTCVIDGTPDHTVPYMLLRDDILVIDYSPLIPHFSRYIESYRLDPRGKELWLLDRNPNIPDTPHLAIKLTRPERASSA